MLAYQNWVWTSVSAVEAGTVQFGTALLTLFADSTTWISYKDWLKTDVFLLWRLFLGVFQHVLIWDVIIECLSLFVKILWWCPLLWSFIGFNAQMLKSELANFRVPHLQVWGLSELVTTSRCLDGHCVGGARSDHWWDPWQAANCHAAGCAQHPVRLTDM